MFHEIFQGKKIMKFCITIDTEAKPDPLYY